MGIKMTVKIRIMAACTGSALFGLEFFSFESFNL